MLREQNMRLRKKVARSRRCNLALRKRVKMLEAEIEQKANGILSVLGNGKSGKLSEWGFEAHHRYNDDLSIYPSHTITAANKADALRQAKQWLRERLAGDGFRWETKSSAYKLVVYREDE